MLQTRQQSLSSGRATLPASQSDPSETARALQRARTTQRSRLQIRSREPGPKLWGGTEREAASLGLACWPRAGIGSQQSANDLCRKLWSAGQQLAMRCRNFLRDLIFFFLHALQSASAGVARRRCSLFHDDVPRRVLFSINRRARFPERFLVGARFLASGGLADFRLAPRPFCSSLSFIHHAREGNEECGPQ